jgi:hypothetical protein
LPQSSEYHAAKDSGAKNRAGDAAGPATNPACRLHFDHERKKQKRHLIPVRIAERLPGFLPNNWQG